MSYATRREGVGEAEVLGQHLSGVGFNEGDDSKTFSLVHLVNNGSSTAIEDEKVVSMEASGREEGNEAFLTLEAEVDPVSRELEEEAIQDTPMMLAHEEDDEAKQVSRELEEEAIQDTPMMLTQEEDDEAKQEHSQQSGQRSECESDDSYSNQEEGFAGEDGNGCGGAHLLITNTLTVSCVRRL